MTTRLYTLDPEPTTAWAPFGGCRPLSELRVGAWLIRERWEGATEAESAALLVPPMLESFVDDATVPEARPVGPISGPAIIGLSTFAPSGEHLGDLPPELTGLENDGEIVGWWVPPAHEWSPGASATATAEIHGISLVGAWDILPATEDFLSADTADFARQPGDEVPDGSIVIGDPSDVVLLGSRVEPNVVFDTRSGPIVLQSNSYVKGGTRFEGPVYVGPHTQILGGLIKNSAIGPMCKLHGEIQSSVFVGYASKVHDGFVGHSILGRWVNLGAGTTTSNLKNTYGPVRLQVGDERIETGLSNVGTIFGDHAKVAIGTFLDTGTIVGTGANVFGTSRPPKYVPPYAWGVGGERMTKEGFLATAERVLPRRKIEFTDTVRQSLSALYDHATA